jgi:parallel beta-helix repeat protein
MNKRWFVVAGFVAGAVTVSLDGCGSSSAGDGVGGAGGAGASSVTHSSSSSGAHAQGGSGGAGGGGATGVGGDAGGPHPPADLQQAIDAAAPGSTLDVTGGTYAGNFTIAKPLTLEGGTITVATGTGITVSASGVSILDITIRGPGSAPPFEQTSRGIYTAGTSGGRIDGFVVKGCTISGFHNAGIWTEYTSGEHISGCTITDVDYAGVMVLSDDQGTISDNTIRRVGYPSGSCVPTCNAGDNNAYNIAVTDGGADPSTGTVVRGNTCTDNPFWQGLDTHGGVMLQFSNNVIQRVSRALFITASADQAKNILVSGNHFLSPSPVTYNLVPLTLYWVKGVTITGNDFEGWGGQSPTPAMPYYDYGGLSTNIVNGGGNTVTP